MKGVMGGLFWKALFLALRPRRTARRVLSWLAHPRRGCPSPPSPKIERGGEGHPTQQGAYRWNCVVTGETKEVAGRHYTLVNKRRGMSFYLDDAFLYTLRRINSPGVVKEVARNFGISEEMSARVVEVILRGGFVMPEEAEDAQEQVFVSASMPRPPASKPKVSIVIVNWNGRSHLGECLESVRRQSFRNYEVILVDNGSGDGSVEFVRRNYPEVVIVENEKNRGFCGGNNDGIRVARGDYLFLLNNDTLLEDDCLYQLVKEMEAKPEDCIGVFPKVIFYEEPFIINSLGGAFWSYRHYWGDYRLGMVDLGQFVESERVFGAIFAAVLLDARKFHELGLFDEDFFSFMEDFDVCYRANILGYAFYTAPHAVVRHKYGVSWRESNPLWSEYYNIRNCLMAVFKNYEGSNLMKHGPRIIRNYLWDYLRAAVDRRDKERVLLVCRIVLYLVSHLPNLLKERWKIQKRRKVEDEAVWDWEESHPVLFDFKRKAVFLGLDNLTFSRSRSNDL
jgi:hypothetical protein